MGGSKRRLTKVSYEDGLFDFNVGYIGTAILAVVFLALGALVQYGSPETVEMVWRKIYRATYQYVCKYYR